MNPREYPSKDVPSWATSMIGNYRSSLKLPNLTDGQIMYLLDHFSGMMPEDLDEVLQEADNGELAL